VGKNFSLVVLLEDLIENNKYSADDMIDSMMYSLLITLPVVVIDWRSPIGTAVFRQLPF
jgi:hypothetical protein